MTHYPFAPADARLDPFSAAHHEHEARQSQRDHPTPAGSGFRELRSYPCGCQHRNVADGRGRPAGWTFCDYHRDGRDLEPIS